MKTLFFTILLVSKIFSFQSDVTDSVDTETLLKTYKSTYLDRKFIRKLANREIKTVVIIGLYTGLDTIALHNYYNCPVYAFECDPRRFEVIERRFKPYPKITLIKKACSNVSGYVDFYQAAFPGASSLFEFDLDTMSEHNNMTKEELLVFEEGMCFQKKIQVEAIRLDEWMQEAGIDKIDLLGMDVQGASYEVLQGLGKRIKDVRYVICEGEFKSVYKDEVLLPDIHRFMLEQGFECLNPMEEESGLFCDLLFRNTQFKK